MSLTKKTGKYESMIDQQVFQTIHQLGNRGKSGLLGSDDQAALITIVAAAYTYHLAYRAANHVLTPALGSLYRSLMEVGKSMELDRV